MSRQNDENRTEAVPDPKIAELEASNVDLQAQLDAAKGALTDASDQLRGIQAVASKVVAGAKRHTPGAAVAEIDVDLISELRSKLV